MRGGGRGRCIQSLQPRTLQAQRLMDDESTSTSGTIDYLLAVIFNTNAQDNAYAFGRLIRVGA
jgi:hypothetical protein